MLGDLNDVPFSAAAAALEGAGLTNLMDGLPAEERDTYVFEGNAQALDHLFVSPALAAALVPGGYQLVHANDELAEQVSDHDPQVARFALLGPRGTPSPAASPAAPVAGCD